MDKERKVFDVPIADVHMDQPVYEVPLQSSMSLNFVISNLPFASSNEPVASPLHNNSFERSSSQHASSEKLGQQSSSYSSDKKRNTKDEKENMKDKNKRMLDKNDENSDDELDVEKLELASKKKSSFNHMTWRIPSLKQAPLLPSSVIVYSIPEIIVIIKMTCSNERTLRNPRLHNLLIDIAENCANRLIKMSSLSLPKLSPRHMDSLPLGDQKSTKSHIEQLSQQLNEQLSLSDVAYRYQSENVYLGSYVSDQVKSTKECAIGSSGVVAVLTRTNKYATIEAFSEQLCKHIAALKPTSLGHISEADVKKINKRGTLKIAHLQKDQLLLQNFLSDPTIIVAEAARRSFVKIEDFLLFHQKQAFD